MLVTAFKSLHFSALGEYIGECNMSLFLVHLVFIYLLNYIKVFLLQNYFESMLQSLIIHFKCNFEFSPLKILQFKEDTDQSQF